METYRVQRSEKIKLVEFIKNSLEQSGFSVESVPDARTAPFEFSVTSSWGERLELICYAFFANKYEQGNRPEDEHRFQVKYGSDFHRAHEIYISDRPSIVTLFLGIHLDENIVVAVDPAMHNPTWFSSSIEFKSHHIEEIQRTGWFGWERERSETRRRAGPQSILLNLQTETLLGFTPDRFGDYIQLEKQCTGIPSGERLLAIETCAFGPDDRHVLESVLEMSSRDILDAIHARNRLFVAVRGAAAEIHLGRLLRAEATLSGVEDIDQDGQPDFQVNFQGRAYRIECKNTARTLVRGQPKVDFQKTRAAIGNPCSRYYRPEQFEVLAACLHPITTRWEFMFCPTRILPPHASCQGHISQNILVDDAVWTPSIAEALEAAM